MNSEAFGDFGECLKHDMAIAAAQRRPIGITARDGSGSNACGPSCFDVAGLITDANGFHSRNSGSLHCTLEPGGVAERRRAAIEVRNHRRG